MLRIGISASTILSDSDRLDEVFWEGIDHIEIGALSSHRDLTYLLRKAQDKRISVGFHSPVFAGGSKYDLLVPVDGEIESAWSQIEQEMALAQDNGVEYVLMHFPYFETSSTPNSISRMEWGLERLRSLQERYATRLVCEPKLGDNRNAGAIEILRRYSVEKWASWGIAMCWDMGDYLLATGSSDESVLELRRLSSIIEVVHVHNVQVESGKYFWVPIHPSHEEDDGFFRIAPILSEMKNMDAVLVWEHTPHFTPSEEFAVEGFKWAVNLLGFGSRSS